MKTEITINMTLQDILDMYTLVYGAQGGELFLDGKKCDTSRELIIVVKIDGSKVLKDFKEFQGELENCYDDMFSQLRGGEPKIEKVPGYR